MNLAQTINQKLNGYRILVTEDNELSQLIVKEILWAAGADVAIAANGKEALEFLNTQSFDCILMDIQMPVMDGLEATEKIRSSSQWVKLPIIALTANTDQQYRDLCQQVGMNDFIAKPVSPGLLIAVILKWL
ncbi:MAG: response regulator [Nitrosomonas sp.]